jgi:hypothetical protein
MKLDFTVCLGIFLASLFIIVMGAFIFYVPVLTIITGATMILGLALMYALGFVTGRRERKLSRYQHRPGGFRRFPENLSVIR